MNTTTGRDWYPVIFAELNRIGATEAGIGVREVREEDPGIWIEFFAEGIDGFWVGLWICDIEHAPLFLDSISDNETIDPSDFGVCFRDYFLDGDDGPDEDEDEGDAP